MTQVVVQCADALPWLRMPENSGACGAVVTSLPDAAETGQPLDVWRTWFYDAVQLCLRCTTPGAPTIFLQTDRKQGGQWHSKAHMVLHAAHALGIPCLWHRIVLRRQPGATDLHRPGYSHLLAFGTCGPGIGPDVIAGGVKAYANAAGGEAARMAVGFAAGRATMLTDPFCGQGAFPAEAVRTGRFGQVHAVDIDQAQCAATEAACAAAATEQLVL